MKHATPLLLLAALLGLSQCKKKDPDPLSLLPPATQTGANTFGCLINEEPFTPQGRVGLGQNLSFEYDPTFNGGTFGVYAYKAKKEYQQAIILDAVPLTTPGTYSFALVGGVAQAAYTDTRLVAPCSEILTEQSFVYRQGNLRITRLDAAAGIVSGTFELKLVAAGGCDTIRLTQGRFDLRR